MKINIEEVETFNPITVSITIETAEELIVLDNMSCRDVFIPELIERHSCLEDGVAGTIAKNFLQNLHTALRSRGGQ